jgi:hypothetical protein
MAKSRLLALAVVAFVGLAASSASAGDYRPVAQFRCAPDDDACYRHAQRIIHRNEYRIAYLEADPYTDLDFKEFAITKAHIKIVRWRAAAGLRPIFWDGPCCYTRRPIRIR